MSEEKKENMTPEETPSAQKKPEGLFAPRQQKKPEHQWASEGAAVPTEEKPKEESPKQPEEPAKEVPSAPAQEPKPWETFAAQKGAAQQSGQPKQADPANQAGQQPPVHGAAQPPFPGQQSHPQNQQAQPPQQPHPQGPGAYPPPYGQQPPYQQGGPRPYPGAPGPWQGYNGYPNPNQPAPWQNQQPPHGGQPPYPPYGGNGGYPPYPPQPPKSRGFKVFIGILIALLVIFLLGLFTSAIWSAFNAPIDQPANPGSSSSEEYTPNPPESSAPEQTPELPETSGNAVPAPDGEVTDPDSTGMQLQSKPAGGALDATEIYQEVAPSIVCVLTQTQTASGIGSGIIASEDGYIFTNSHVINDSRDVAVTVLLHDGREYNAAIVGFDKITDLAVLKIDAAGLTPAVFGDSDDLVVGEVVYAIGNPSGVQYASSMTNGIVSGLNRPVSYSNTANMTYIQTNAAISPGNSGGALVNEYGQVVGITSSKISGVSYEGINFAIPTARAKAILDDLLTSGYVSNRPRLGISARNAYTPYGTGGGIEIASIDPESPFSGQAQPGDIITAIDGEAVSTMDELYQILGVHSPGDQLTVTLYRNGQQFDITITLIEDRGETQVTPEQNYPVQ